MRTVRASPDAAMFSRGIPSGSDDVDSWEGPLLERREKWRTRVVLGSTLKELELYLREKWATRQSKDE